MWCITMETFRRMPSMRESRESQETPDLYKEAKEMGIDPRDLLPRPPPEERFSKDGINNVEINQYRLLVHCPGCPPFLCLIDPSTTIGNLQKEVGRLHSELFVGRGDIPPIDIRWLEDSQYHALPLNSPVRSVLADRENIYVSTGLDVHRHGVNQFPSHDGSIKGSIAQLRNTCLETASHICATVHQEKRREEVLEAGGLSVLISLALLTGNLIPGDVAIRDIHQGVRQLLEGEDAGERILESGCEAQVTALLQSPDPELAAMAAFLISRLALHHKSHVILLSWGAPARLAKALELAGTPAVRFDAVTTLRLLAKHPSNHPALLMPVVLKSLVNAAVDGFNIACQAKALGALGSMGECGTEQTRMALKAAGAYDAVLRASASNEPNIRRATTLAMAGLRGGAPMSLPPLDEDLEDRRSLATPKDRKSVV